MKCITRYGIVSVILGLLLVCGCGKDKPAELSKTVKDEPVELPKTVTGKDSMEVMLLIPAGEFQMGSNDGEDDEKPVHAVYLDAFYMDKYEVTNAQYRKFVKATGHREPAQYANGELQTEFKVWSDKNLNGDDQPVVLVSLDDAKAYAGWAGKRLPTEAEWEKAARGGLVGKKYPWGDEEPDAGGPYRANSVWFGTDPDGYKFTAAPVGSFAPNDYGLYDMAGNVWEWCLDWYEVDYYANSPKSNPTGPGSGTDRVVRGGGWESGLHSLRAASRGYGSPASGSINFGFRCVRSRSD